MDFQWRYKLNGKTRQVRIGSWPKLSLKALRDERGRLAVEVKSGTDPVQRKATEKLKIDVDQVEAHNKQLDRLEAYRLARARRCLSGPPLQLPHLHRRRAWQTIWPALWCRHGTLAGVYTGRSTRQQEL